MQPIINEIEGGYIVQLKRRFDHPVEKVWEAITQPEKIKEWFAEIEMDYELGGRMEIHFTNSAGNSKVGKIIEIKEPKLFEYIWDIDLNEMLTFELKPTDEATELTLTHIIHDPQHMPSIIGGWESHFDMLEAALDGKPIGFPWNKWESIKNEYSEKL
jgi:uncharacterized protein YndB with AHSA1/START domain